MAATVIVTETAEVLTTDDNNQLLWTAPAGDLNAVIYVDATETTSGSFVNYKRFARQISRYTTFEANVLVTNSDIHADDGTANASDWNITVDDNGSGAIRVQVAGSISMDITWDIIVQRWET